MCDLNPGDIITCRIRSAVIVSKDEDYDEIHSFVIIAQCEEGYHLYVPHYFFLKNSSVLDRHRAKALKIDKRYLGENIAYINDKMIASVESRQDGMNCAICGDFYQYATCNQEDGSMVCFSCKQNPY
jgi:hypothetical protein